MKREAGKMRITSEQIEGEITALESEADRKATEANVLLEDSAMFRKQVELLKQVVELRKLSERHLELMSFIFVGFARQVNDIPTAVCAFTWKGSATHPFSARLALSQEWKNLLPSDLLPYFTALLDDWKQLLLTQPQIMLGMIGRLSTGPIRSIEQGTMHQDRVAQLVDERLGKSCAFP